MQYASKIGLCWTALDSYFNELLSWLSDTLSGGPDSGLTHGSAGRLTQLERLGHELV